MFHLSKEKGPWFRAKRFGYGAGLPFRWQGWVLLLAHMALIIGVAVTVGDRPVIMIPLILLIALAPMPVYAVRTEGGWKWRNGDEA
jgi:hypothetical protein